MSHPGASSPTAAIRSTQRWRLGVATGMAISTMVLGGVLTRDLQSVVCLSGLALAYVLPVWSLRWPRRRLAAFVQLLSGAMASAALGGFSLLTGGTASPAFLGTLAVPIALGLMVPESTWVCLVSGLTAGLFGGGTEWLEGASLGQSTVTALMGLSAGLLGTYGSFQYRQLRAAELRLERERRRVVEELAMVERQSAEAERLVTVGRLATGVAHEINNPLSFVGSNLAYLRDVVEAGDVASQRAELDEALREAHDGLERIRHIVSDLGLLARPSTHVTADADAKASLDAAVRIAQVKAGHATRFEVLAPATAQARIDGGRLVQVLVNLLVNAIDAIDSAPRGGGNTVWVRLDEHDGRVRLAIEDDGPGLTPGVRASLFEPFFTTKPPGKGTGLGLALSRQYVTEAGGTIEAGDRPGGGARFTIELDRAG